MGVTVVIVFIAGIFGIVTWVSRVQTAHHNSALARIAARMERGTHGDAEAHGAVRGVRLTYRLATRGSGSSSESWTEVDVEVPAAYPLEIHVRRHAWRDRARIERGDMIDVEVGDPEFDAAFLVEAAPAEVARLLLDRSTRALLAEHKHVELDTVSVAERKLLRFATRTWVEEADPAAALIERVAGIAARVRDSFTAVEAATPVRDAGGPFRPQLDDQPAREAARAREAEVQRLEIVRAAREAAQKRIADIVAVVVGLGLVIAFLFAIS